MQITIQTILNRKNQKSINIQKNSDYTVIKKYYLKSLKRLASQIVDVGTQKSIKQIFLFVIGISVFKTEHISFSVRSLLIPGLQVEANIFPALEFEGAVWGK